jgi:nucleotide-binding universal stress UspA family protein
MFHHILVPLDGSNRAERALPVAGRLARTIGSRLLLVRVVNVPLLPGPTHEAPQVLLARAGAELERSEQYLLDAARCSDLADVHVETEALEGPIAATILDIADAERADLIVICSHGHTGALHWPLGSVARDVAKHANAPTLVLREHGSLPLAGADRLPVLARALVALDGTPYAERVIVPAVDLIELLAAPAHSEVHLIASASASPRDDLETYLGRLADDLSRTVLAGRTVTVTWSLADDDNPVSALAAASSGDAEGVPPTFLAMSTHGRSGWQRWANGSITERVLAATTLPLLILGRASATDVENGAPLRFSVDAPDTGPGA